LGNVKSWSDFRTEARHNQWVEELLNGFKKYPKSILDILNTNNSIESKARYLRDKGHKKILEEIREHDRKEKLEYLSYLSQQKQDYKKIKRFYILLMLGIHKKEYLADLINDNHFFEEVENLLIYYSNKHKDEILVSKEDIHERLSNALKDSDIFKITFSKDLTYCKIIKQNKNKEKQLLSIVFHWKNIAQGIKTPCLNIFD